MTTAAQNDAAELSVTELWKVFGKGGAAIARDESLRGLTTREIKERTGCVPAVRDVSFDVPRG